MKLLIMQFLHHLIVSPLSDPYRPPRIIIGTTYPITLSLFLCEDQVSHQYKTTDKIILLCILMFIFLDKQREERRYWTEW
jgi:hypothetical protein